jgi:hypothetical protein
MLSGNVGGSGPLRKWGWLLGLVVLASAHAASADEFQKVQCGGDVPKAMIGQRSSNGPVVATEKKYSGIGLKGLGGDEISDSLSSVSWMICGAEYILLIDRAAVVRDVLAFPIHSRTSPAFTGICRYDGKDLPGVYVGVLDGMKHDEFVPVRFAWKIDQKQVKFINVPGEGLLCPRSGIPTSDGGR